MDVLKKIWGRGKHVRKRVGEIDLKKSKKKKEGIFSYESSLGEIRLMTSPVLY